MAKEYFRKEKNARFFFLAYFFPYCRGDSLHCTCVSTIASMGKWTLRLFRPDAKNFSSLSTFPCRIPLALFVLPLRLGARRRCLFHFVAVCRCFLYFIDPIYLSKKHALIASDAHFNIVDHELTENYQKFNGLLFCCLVFFHHFFVTSAKAFPLNWISCNKHFNQKINIFNR